MVVFPRHEPDWKQAVDGDDDSDACKERKKEKGEKR
jgi:hypothetical protein